MFFHAIKITEYTDKMFDIMKKEFGQNFEISELTKPEELKKVLISTMSSSILKSQMAI